MISQAHKYIHDSWNTIFDHEKSPLKNIPDVNTRHMILQILAWMWVTAFSIMIGSWTGFLASAVGHIAILAALAVTVGTYAEAQRTPNAFTNLRGRSDGEHE